MGLYACLFLLTPAILFMILKRQTRLLSAISWIVYLVNLGASESAPGTAEIRITGAQFEYAFPLVAWQLIYVHSVMAGCYKREIVRLFSRPAWRWLIWTCVVMSVSFMLFALDHPMTQFPVWEQLDILPDEVFGKIYNGYFEKYKLGPGRLLNEIVLFVTVFAVLTRFWLPIDAALGWLFIPLGAASLYVFTVHLFLLLAVANSPLPGLHNFWVDGAIHAGALLVAWWGVKTQFLFRWLPH
jgi:hypothetical protein